MPAQLVFTQLLNGLQFGVFLFLMASGLTLVLGVMNFINLAHGSFFMIGAYLGAATFAVTNSFLVSVATAVAGAGLLGFVLEVTLFARIRRKGPLAQVLATFGLILFFNEAVKIVWGNSPLYVSIPEILADSVRLFGFSYPIYRLMIVALGAVVALGIWLLVHKTRVGMLIRAGATHPQTVEALGVNIGAVNAGVLALGAGLAGLAGAVAGPLLSVQSGMGDPILVLTLVVIVLGGVGSSRGAFIAALIVGLIDTAGRAFVPLLFRMVADRSVANAAGPAVASMLIYCVMAAILALKPDGLFPAQRRKA